MNEFKVKELFVIAEIGIVFAGSSSFTGLIEKCHAKLIVEGFPPLIIKLDGECLLSPPNPALRAISTKTPIPIAHEKLRSGTCTIHWE